MMPCSKARAASGFPDDLRPGLGTPAGLRVEAPQPGRVAHSGPQNTRGWRCPHGPTDDSLAVRFELRRRETDQTPATRFGGSLMEPLGAAVKHDLPWLQLHAAQTIGGLPRAANPTKTSAGANEI